MFFGFSHFFRKKFKFYSDKWSFIFLQCFVIPMQKFRAKTRIPLEKYLHKTMWDICAVFLWEREVSTRHVCEKGQEWWDDNSVLKNAFWLRVLALEREKSVETKKFIYPSRIWTFLWEKCEKCISSHFLGVFLFLAFFSQKIQILLG